MIALLANFVSTKVTGMILFLIFDIQKIEWQFHLEKVYELYRRLYI